MKLASKDEVNNYTTAIVIGGLKGAAVGLGLSMGIRYWAQRHSSLYRAMTPTFKTFFFLVPVLGCGITTTEWASLKFDMDTYDFGDGDKKLQQEREKFDQLPVMDRIRIGAINHKYKIIVGAWAASLGGSFWWVNRDKYLTSSQKLVQARMYAQALTVVILLGSMLMSVNSMQAPTKPEDEEYSWQAIAAEEESREKAAGEPTRLQHPPHKHETRKD
ncbi:hypothetical protein D0Z00_004329 [Geotrichum galactomycetum]|uniref:Uncharacterized protein n=1 Tax=Geotrichum galactomycetum TaxID=27317 RepID=A0ACB6UYS0_9ASCO|nr:hypothetical protein D0Z00_004329 [Geotrichum candidum]